MYLEALLSVFTLNLTVPHFLVGHNGTIIITVGGRWSPNVYIDFGDSENITLKPSDFMYHQEESTEGEFPTVEVSVSHCYSNVGSYIIHVNASDDLNHSVQSAIAVVDEPITGVELILLTESLVALFDEVAVKATVQSGTNLRFMWDFGDSTDGEYTNVSNDGKSSIAHHSYAIPDTYTISVAVMTGNDSEFIMAFLNASVRAVEPMEQLHVRPISGRFAAPLLPSVFDGEGTSTSYNTKVILFEAKLYRGSDVEFLFDFGDGWEESVPLELNVWSVPLGIATHSYTEEGAYVVTVTATNPLGSLTQKLEKPFYVQFPPEGLSLDQRYYILPKDQVLHITATVSKGTNLSFHWFLSGNELSGTNGPEMHIPFTKSGTYLVRVDASNKVTDFAYEFITRPSASAKVYVQDVLRGIELCVISSERREVCEGTVEMPLDEEIECIVRVTPVSEKALRFIWQIGTQELKRTNVPRLKHRYRTSGLYTVNITAQNHISSISSGSVQLNLMQKISNRTTIRYEEPNLVNQPVSFHARYWFGTSLTFQWNFGDGSPIVQTQLDSVQHIYTQTGEYWVTLHVWNKFSEVQVTTNIFILNHVCQKPEISLLDQSKDRVIAVSDDILLEADIITLCPENPHALFTWTLSDILGREVVRDILPSRLNERQLLLAKHSLLPGVYHVELKVEMIGTIVYAATSTSLTITPAAPLTSIEGGFSRWVGRNNFVSMAITFIQGFESTENLSFYWSCSPLSMSYTSCFKSEPPAAFTSTSHSNFTLPVASLDDHLSAAVINVTVSGEKQAMSSQVLEIRNVPHSLLLSVRCHTCHNHRANEDQWLKFSATCENCPTEDTKYKWKIWLVQDGAHDLYPDFHECVQADGSTQFIFASNTSAHESNITAINVSHDEFDAASVEPSFNDDLPPFPSLPGFPDEQSSAFNVEVKSRLQRNSDVIMDEMMHMQLVYPPFPIEGEVLYEDNSSLPEAFQEYFPGHDFLTEEGHPGEGGSAAARDQSGLQHFGIPTPINQDNRILEGAGHGRGITGNSLPDLYPVRIGNPYPVGDPVRFDSVPHEVPHLAKLPRLLLTLSHNHTSSGFNSENLVLKPGALQTGKMYLVQVYAVSSGIPSADGSAMESVKINAGPQNGRCTLMPTQGYGLDFIYGLHCFEWQSESPHLYYELNYSLYPDGESHLVYFGFNKNVKFVLPVGLAGNDFNVYLNVIVRDSQGAGTRVCSLIREVRPQNTSLERNIYNQTFDSKSALNKLIGEKNNQAVLNRIHVLATSMNEAHSDRAKNLDMRGKVRRRLLELIGKLAIFSKAEAVQATSALTAVMFVPEEVSPAELKHGWDLFLGIYNTKSTLCGTYPLELLTMRVLSFLDKFIFFTSASDNTKLIEASKLAKRIMQSEVEGEVEKLLIGEEDRIFELEHRTISAGYVTSQRVRSGHYFIRVKKSTVVLPEHLVHNKLEGTVPCIAVVEEQFTTFKNYPHSLSIERGSIVSLLPSSCFESFHGEIQPSNFSITVHFQRDRPEDLNQSFSLWKKNVNVHVVNLTHNSIGQSLLFVIELLPITNEKQDFALKVMFNYESIPTLKSNLLAKQFEGGNDELRVFIPGDMVKSSGLYYLTVVDADYSVGYEYKDTDVERQYKLVGWRQHCLQKIKTVWSPHGCTVVDTSTPQFVHCKCSSLSGITSFSKPIGPEFVLLSIDHLMEGNYNVAPVIFWVLLMAIYTCLCISAYYDDVKKSPKLFPVNLKDNLPDHKYKYVITVRTGSFHDAGTTSCVYLVLHGQNDVTETRQLICHDALCTTFQRGSTDTFLLTTSRNLGPLMKLEVWHNNSGPSPSWYLQDVDIKDFQDDSVYYFQCRRWFSVEKEDGKIEREIPVSDQKPKFLEVLHDHLVASLNDINIWNSVVCSSPVSHFTGVQRITCCLSLVLNSAALMLWLHSLPFFESDKHVIIPHISLTSLCEIVIITILISLPQLISALLFKYSEVPQTDLVSGFRSLFITWTRESLYCWLQQKHSSHRSSSSESSSSVVESSGSSYNSLSHSSLRQSGFSIDISSDGKEAISDSIPSSLDLCVPVSPLERTLSTWQAFESWAKRKTENYPISDFLPDDRRTVIQNWPQENTQHSGNFSKIQNGNPGNVVLISDIAPTLYNNEVINGGEVPENAFSNRKVQEKDVSEPLKLLPVYFYFLGWLLLIFQCSFSSYVINFYGIRIGIWKCVQWFENILVSVLCSCFLLCPVLAFSVAVVKTLKFLRQQRQFKIPLNPVDRQANDADDYEIDEYRRRAYFVNYLRPPPESVLNEFRKTTLKHQFVLSSLKNVMSCMVVLVILVVMAFFNHNHSYFLQKESIEKAFFAMSPRHTLTKVDDFWDWMKLDFLSTFYGDYTCLDEPYNHGECGISVLCNSYPIGSPVLRKFLDLPSTCITSEKYKLHSICGVTDDNPEKDLQSRYNSLYKIILWGCQGHYYDSSITVALNKSRYETYMQLDQMEPWIDKHTKAMSLEFLLFNPTLSTFTAVIFLMEFNHSTSVSFTSIVLPFHLYQYTSLGDYVRLFCELLFLVLFLINAKREIWRMLKLKKSYWNCPWSWLEVIFLVFSSCYASCDVFYVVAINEALEQLRDSHMESYINLIHIPYLAMAEQNLIGLLLFLHLIRTLKCLQIKPFLFSFVKTCGSCWKQIVFCGALGMFLLLNCGFVGNAIIGRTRQKTLGFPLVQCLQAINFFMAGYKKPEISSHDSLLVVIFSFAFMFFVFWITLCTLTMIRVILINSQKYREKPVCESITLPEAGKLIKKRLANHFKANPHRITSTESPTLPMEFLLLELETLTDKLVSKANSLFSDSVGVVDEEEDGSRSTDQYDEVSLSDDLSVETYAVKRFLEFQMEMFNENHPRSSYEGSCESINSVSSIKSSHASKVPDEEDRSCDITKTRRLPLTLPRSSSRTRANNCSKVSFFTSSLSSQRGQSKKTANSPMNSHHQGRIRKTHPLRKTGSISSFLDNTDFPHQKTDNSPSVLSIRKTKSRGKGKNQGLNLDHFHLNDDSIL